jgi:hypothetical protein
MRVVKEKHSSGFGRNVCNHWRSSELFARHLFFGVAAIDIFKMRAIFKSFWVRKLIGKLGIPYNRRLRVRGLLNPVVFDAGLSPAASESNAFHVPVQG